MISFALAKCHYCGQEFLAQSRELKRGNAKFCSRSCSSSFNNSLRKKHPIPNQTCSYCGRSLYRKPSLIKSTNCYCSKDCFQKASGKAFSRERIIQLIQEYYSTFNRIPVHSDFSKQKGWLNPSTVKCYFGTWNNAIEAAGFLTNSASIGYICYAKDGHMCRSHCEMVIDDWLLENNVDHEKEVRYPNSKLIADWRIGAVYIEYFGIDVERNNRISQDYVRAINRKRELCKSQNIILIELISTKANELEAVIKPFIGMSVKPNCFVRVQEYTAHQHYFIVSFLKEFSVSTITVNICFGLNTYNFRDRR